MTRMVKSAPFDAHAVEYGAWFEQHPELYQVELEAVRSILPPGQGVEIGVGTGRFAAPLRIPLGVEPAPGMAALARQRGVTVVEGVAEHLPFADHSFDYAVMVTVVCFLANVAQALREARRILKPQGSLIIGFIDRESALGRQYNQRKDQSRFYRAATFYSIGELEALLTSAGFTDFVYRQALFPDEVTPTNVREGHGTGGFVVVRARNP